MDSLYSLIRTLIDNGLTWQETIIMSFFIMGLTLCVFVLVKGVISLISLFLRTVDNAIEKFTPQRIEKATEK